MSTAAPPTPEPARARRWGDAVWLAVLAAWTAGWCLSAAPHLGVTYDEPFYLDAGVDAWRGWTRDDGKPRRWDHAVFAVTGVMPLPVDAATLPLFIREYRTGEKLPSGGRKLEYLRGARAVTLGWLWLLVFSAWRLGWAAGGPWAGRVAAGLVAADPNFLGHASVATTDICVTATLTAFAHAVYAGRSGGWWKRLVWPGLWFGVAAASKLSALLYGGVILVTLEVCYRFASGAMARALEASGSAWARQVFGVVLRSVLNAAAILSLGVALAIAYVGFPHEGERPFVRMVANIPPSEEIKARYEKWAAGPLDGRVPHAVCAFAFQWWHNSEGRPTYLDGTYYPAAYRWYFPVLLLMKLPLPVFALALAALLRLRAAANPLAVVTLLLFLTLLTAKIQIGVRLAFPVMALGYVALAVAVARGYPRCAPWLGGAAVFVMAITSAWVWPHGISYLNQAWGGPGAAHRRVTDSNVDWGHGLPDLKAWGAANGGPTIRVWYFGTDPAVRKPPFEYFELESVTPEITNAEELREAVGPHVLAVGHTVGTLHPTTPRAKAVALEYLRTRRPLARTATFTLYDFRTGLPPALDE